MLIGVTTFFPPRNNTILGVTHYFGHLGDTFTGMCSSSQKDLSHEKSEWCPPLQSLFLEGHRRLGVLHSAEMPDFRRLL
jgi:hypothetical protein